MGRWQLRLFPLALGRTLTRSLVSPLGHLSSMATVQLACRRDPKISLIWSIGMLTLVYLTAILRTNEEDSEEASDVAHEIVSEMRDAFRRDLEEQDPSVARRTTLQGRPSFIQRHENSNLEIQPPTELSQCQ